jgi:hypothetical protein
VKSITQNNSRAFCYEILTMFRFSGLCFGILVRHFRGRQSLLLENLALRQQLVARAYAILKETSKAKNTYGSFLFSGKIPIPISYPEASESRIRTFGAVLVNVQLKEPPYPKPHGCGSALISKWSDPVGQQIGGVTGIEVRTSCAQGRSSMPLARRSLVTLPM